MVLTLISQIAVLDTAITYIIDSGALVPPTYTVWIRVRNDYSYPVDVYIQPKEIPYGEYIADTFDFGGTTLSVNNCLTIPQNYAIKNQTFDRIAICQHGWVAYLKPSDADPTDVSGGYNSYDYWANFLDNGSPSQLDTLSITITPDRIDVYGVKIDANGYYRDRIYTQFYYLNAQRRVKEIGLILGPAEVNTVMYMYGSPLSKFGGNVNYWDDAILLALLFNFEQGVNITLYKEIQFLDTLQPIVNGVKTIPPGGVDSFPVIINLLALKQEQPSRTYYGRYTGGFFLYKVGDSNPVGWSNIYVKQNGPFSSFSENNGIIANKPPFIYKNGRLILTEKGVYRIYSVDGSILGYVNSNGNFNIRHLKPGIYIINYEGKSYKAIVR